MLKMKKSLVIFVVIAIVFCLALLVLSNYIPFLSFWENLILTIVGSITLFAIAIWMPEKLEETTDGDLVAGVDDGDGLVIRLDTPINELVEKDRVVFNVVKEEKE